MGLLQLKSDRRLDVVPLGRVTIDLNPVDMYRTLAESTTFKKYLGGSPANIAVGIARLGRKAGFIGKVSDDRFGDFVVDYFKKEGIDVSGVSRAENGESLGLTFTEILSEKESSILMYRNSAADLSLDLPDIREDYIAEAKILVISGTALAASPSREAAFKALFFAKKHGTAVVFDIDYREYTWRSKEEMAVYYALVGGRADMIIGSKEEFDLMQGLEGKALSDEETAAKWFASGSGIIVIKHGKKGSRVYASDGSCYVAEPQPVKKLKGFGGGDAYASAFIYGLLEGWDIRRALEFGNASASLLVAAHSCSDAMPAPEKIQEFIDAGRAEYGDLVRQVR
jgi:5-dehydro-2-deoxygluconokinase